MKRLKLCLLILMVIISVMPLSAQTTLYSQQDGNINDATVTWNTESDGSGSFQAPITGDTLIIQSSNTITVNVSSISPDSIDFTGSGTLVIGAQSLTITGGLTGSGGTVTVDATGTINVDGRISPGTLTCAGNSTILVGGDWEVGSFTSGTSTVTFDGSVGQSINVFSSFYNLTINKTDTLFTAANFDMDNVLSLSNGIFEVASGNIVNFFNTGIVVNRTGGNFSDRSAGQLNFDDSATIQSDASINLPGLKFTRTAIRTLTLSSGSAVIFTVFGDIERGGRHSLSLNNVTLRYASSATLKYSASSVPMTVDLEWPTGSADRPDNVTLLTGNSVNVILSSGRDIDGIFLLAQSSGNLVISGGTLNINGTLERRTSGTTGIALSGGAISYGTTGSLLRYNTTANTTISEEWPAGASDRPESVEITVTGGNSLSSSGAISRTIVEDLTLNVGTVNFGSGTLTVLGTVTGSEISGSAIIADASTLFLGNSGSGVSNSQRITGTLTLNKLTINKTGGANADSNTVRLEGTASFTSGGVLTITAGTLDMIGSGRFSGNRPATLNVNGTLRTGGTNISSISTINASSGTIIFTGTESSENLPANTTIGTIEINNSDGVNVSTGRLDVSSSLVLTNGRITVSRLQNDTLRLGTGASVAGSPSSTAMIIGPLQKAFTSGASTFSYPIGFGTSYRPAEFEYLSNSVATSIIEIEAASGDPGGTPPTGSGINSISTSHYYIVAEKGVEGSFTYNFTGTYTGTGFSPETRNRLIVQNSTSPTTYTYPNSPAQTVDPTPSVQTVKINEALSNLPTNDGIIAFGSTGATITWDGGISGTGTLWSVAANWVGDQVPQNGDAVLLDNSTLSGTYKVIYNTAVSQTSFESISVNSDGTGNIRLQLDKSASINLTNTTSALVVGSSDSLTFNGSSVTMGASYDSSLTNMQIGSTILYNTGLVYVDTYGDLTINGASGTSGSDDILVKGNLIKNSSTGFSTAQNIVVQGSYTNTSGNATYSGGLTVFGSTFTLSGGVLSGLITVNSSTITVNGGSFGGTITFSGSDIQTLSGTANAVFNNLTINKSSNGLTLSNTAQIDAILTLTNGIITTSGVNTLTLTAPGSSISGGNGNSFINGPLNYAGNGNKIFPVGKVTTYRPLRATNTTGTTIFEVFNNNPNGSPDVTLNNISVVRYWLGSGTITNGTIELSYGADDGVSLPDSLVVASSGSVNGTYTNRGNSGLNQNFSQSVRSSNISTLEYFTLGSESPDNSLPVALSSFDADVSVSSVRLLWVTESELNNNGFNVYRKEKESAGDWQLLNPALIAGQGNTSNSTTYEFYDRQVSPGKTYLYKLESVSFSGVNATEQIVEIAVPLPAEYTLFSNYPNPFNPATNLRFQLPENSRITIDIYNINGNLVKKLVSQQMYSAGEHVVTWDATDNSGSQLASGQYFYRFSAGNFVKTGKMLLLK